MYVACCLPSWLIGPRPEFVDPQHVAQGEGRDSEFCAGIHVVTLADCIWLDTYIQCTCGLFDHYSK